MSRQLQSQGLATLAVELLNAAESQSRHPVLDLPLLGVRLLGALHWLGGHSGLAALPLGLLGLGNGACAALLACARAPAQVGALVTQGGRPDLAGAQIRQVRAPTLWITDNADAGMVELKRHAMRGLAGPSRLQVLTHRAAPDNGESLGHAAALLAGHWFTAHLPRHT